MMLYFKTKKKASEGWNSVFESLKSNKKGFARLRACIMFWQWEKKFKISANIILYLSFPSSQLQHSFYSVSQILFSEFPICSPSVLVCFPNDMCPGASWDTWSGPGCTCFSTAYCYQCEPCRQTIIFCWPHANNGHKDLKLISNWITICENEPL